MSKEKVAPFTAINIGEYETNIERTRYLASLSINVFPPLQEKILAARQAVENHNELYQAQFGSKPIPHQNPSSLDDQE